MQNILRKYIRESLRHFLLINGNLKNCESLIQSEVSTLAGLSITGHVSASDKDLEDDLKKNGDIAKSFGGGEYEE